MIETLDKILELSNLRSITYAQYWNITYAFLRSCQGENPNFLKFNKASLISGNQGIKGFIETAPLVFLYPTFDSLVIEDFVRFRPFPMYLIQLTCKITAADRFGFPPADFVGHDLGHSYQMWGWDIVWLNQAAQDGQIFSTPSPLIGRVNLLGPYNNKIPGEILSIWGGQVRARAKEINLDKVAQLVNTRQKYYNELLEPIQLKENTKKIMNDIFGFSHENGFSLGPENDDKLLKYTGGGKESGSSEK